MATPALSTLRHVTERKLGKLADHHEKFEAEKKSISAKVASAPDHRSKVEALLDGFEQHGITAKDPELSIANLKRFIHQAEHDPSVSATLLSDWQSKLEHQLDLTSVKYEYAALFGKLVIEWIKHPNPAASAPTTNAASSDSDREMSESFDTIGRKEMHEQRKEWESYAFTERKVDQEKIVKYLDEIFGTTLQAKKVTKTPLQNLRDSMKHVMDFKSDLQPVIKKNTLYDNVTSKGSGTAYRFDVDTLKSCIQGVLGSDLLAGAKRESLSDLTNQPAVLRELVDVLNMDLEGLDKWEWDPSPVPLNMRRQLNGKYRVYMDEEIHQAVLLHFIGTTWAVALKQAFTAFYHSGAWLQSPYRSMGKKARERHEYFVPRGASHLNVRNRRRERYQRDYFMTQLPDSEFEDPPDYNAEDQDENQSWSRSSPLATKQSMLRLVTAELLLNTKVYGEFLVLQSDFKWFGPSLPHDTIFAVLTFFGVPEKWLRFFKKFLEAPVAFAQDGPDAEAVERKCGIPMSHVLSDALSEAVLFCLDFAVNKRTQGANIHRFHDDLWFWGQESTCIQAWNAILEFSKVMGLQLNEDKTGAALIVADEAASRSLPAALPKGPIKWGFLNLNPSSGRWVIDRAQVDEHVEELRRQLAACQSVMAWVQAWNSYVSRFFSTHFGQPANCFGRQHNDMIIKTYEHIQRSLFKDAGTANVTEYLRGMLKERFGTDDSVPDGFFYFPYELGGLGLRNPLINAFATYRKSFRDSAERIDRAFEMEKADYDSFKERWESGENRPKRMKFSHPPKDETGTDTEADDPFMSFEEYTRYREETSVHLRNAYVNLQECPPEEKVETLPAIRDMLRERSLEESPYWLWIYDLYAGDMNRRFGGLQLGERDLLPVGLVDVLRSERVRWEG